LTAIGVSFDNSDIAGADLREASLRGVKFIECRMNDADLFLNVFNLTMVTLDDVDLRETNLDGIIYDPVTLEFLASANLKGIKMDEHLCRDIERTRAERFERDLPLRSRSAASIWGSFLPVRISATPQQIE